MPASSSGGCRFSILLPTHNRAEVLGYAIRSLLWQSERDFEVLVVGDGCTDNTADVVRAFDDPRIRWFDLPKAPNFGYANRNIALRAARGDLIAFMAHDDIVFPDHLERLADCLDESGAELVYSRPLWITRDGAILPSTYNLHDPKTLASFLAREPHSIPALCVMHRRECFAKYGYWDDSLASAADRDMWARIIEGGAQQNFAYQPVSTGLHFHASWKPPQHIGARELRFWIELHKQPGALPPALKVPVPEGIPEQQAVWDAMVSDPIGWTRNLRAAIQQALDHALHASLLKTVEAAQVSAPGPDITSRGRIQSRKIGKTNRIKRLNWGCGRWPKPGWINSDRRPLPGVDLVCDIREGLPIESDALDYVVSIHALIELSYHELLPALQELRRVLKPGGTLRLILPDLLKGVEAFRNGENDYFLIPDENVERLGSKLAVQLTWYGHIHSVFTPDFADELLLKAGFSSVARCKFKETQSRWPKIIELDNRERESFYVEGTK